jgi:hypothetical protein
MRKRWRGRATYQIHYGSLPTHLMVLSFQTRSYTGNQTVMAAARLTTRLAGLVDNHRAITCHRCVPFDLPRVYVRFHEPPITEGEGWWALYGHEENQAHIRLKYSNFFVVDIAVQHHCGRCWSQAQIIWLIDFLALTRGVVAKRDIRAQSKQRTSPLTLTSDERKLVAHFRFFSNNLDLT